MSGNAKPVDRRVRRTLDALGGALLSLVQERPFGSLVVQDVLDRAGVSRTTFYAHYAGMDDLLTSSVDAFFARAATLVDRHAGADDRVVAVRELFAHVAEARPLADALRASGHGPELLAIGRAHFARAIARRLERRGMVTPQGMASALAGALFSLLEWWLDARPAGSPADVDALFHRLVPSLARLA
jgi:AcrR family transcriptional regulator